jgi:hypothetical protein
MVIWFFENNQFANAWIPFDRINQKKLEYVYRHHEELVNCILLQQQQKHSNLIQQPDINIIEAQLQQQQRLEEDCHSNSMDTGAIISQEEKQQQHPGDNLLKKEEEAEQADYIDIIGNKEDNISSNRYQLVDSGNNSSIEDIDSDEEDASIHPFIQYDQNCIYINLNDSHFEQEITLYPAMLLGSLPDRDILIVRAEIMDHNNKYNKYLLNV